MRFIHSVAILAVICIMLQVSISNGSPDDGEISHIDGYVFEAYSDGKPIIFAWISVYDNNTLINKGLSGRNGSYSFSLEPGCLRGVLIHQCVLGSLLELDLLLPLPPLSFSSEDRCYPALPGHRDAQD